MDGGRGNGQGLPGSDELVFARNDLNEGKEAVSPPAASRRRLGSASRSPRKREPRGQAEDRYHDDPGEHERGVQVIADLHDHEAEATGGRDELDREGALKNAYKNSNAAAQPAMQGCDHRVGTRRSQTLRTSVDRRRPVPGSRLR